MSLQKWHIHWSRGPMDNPLDGIVEVTSRSAEGAANAFVNSDESFDQYSIDAVIRADLSEDLAPIRRSEIEERVVSAIRSRRDRGRAKYGVSMERGDLTPEQWCQHAQEEALDLAIYLEKIKRDFPMGTLQSANPERPLWFIGLSFVFAIGTAVGFGASFLWQ